MILISSADSELNPPGWFPISVASGQVEQKHKKIQSPQYLSRKVPPSTLVPPSLPPSSSLPLPSSTPALRQDEQLQNKLLRIPLIPDHTGSPMSRHRKDQEVKGGRECAWTHRRPCNNTGDHDNIRHSPGPWQRTRASSQSRPAGSASRALQA